MLGAAIQSFCQQIKPRFVVLTAAACMPSSCWGSYGRVAVIETDGVNYPKQINPTHKAVKRIVYLADKLNKGTTDRCAFRKALIEAKALAAELNAKRWVA